MDRRTFTAWGLIGAAARQAAAAESVRVGVEDDWYPYAGLHEGSAQGLGVDIVRAAFAAVGVTAQFDVLPYANCTKQVRNGRLLACFNTPRTSEVENEFLWPDDPLYLASAYIYAPATSRACGLSVADLHGQRIATTHGYGYGEGFDGNKAIRTEPALRDINGVRQLLRERVPYFAGFDLAMAYLNQIHPDIRGKTRRVGFIASTPIHLAFSKSHPEGAAWRTRFSQGLQALRRRGDHAALLARWTARYPSSPRTAGDAAACDPLPP